MGNWEKKRDEMQRQIERRSNIVATVSVLLMVAVVFSCARAQKSATDRLTNRDFKVFREMQKQK